MYVYIIFYIVTNSVTDFGCSAYKMKKKMSCMSNVCRVCNVNINDDEKALCKF